MGLFSEETSSERHKANHKYEKEAREELNIKPLRDRIIVLLAGRDVKEPRVMSLASYPPYPVYEDAGVILEIGEDTEQKNSSKYFTNLKRGDSVIFDKNSGIEYKKEKDYEIKIMPRKKIYFVVKDDNVNVASFGRSLRTEEDLRLP
jgi:co-chaperonin GroES (HSP10)